MQLWRHVAAGREVHLLALTRGTATRVRGELNGEVIPPWWNIRHDPSLEGYAPLDPAAVGRARIREQAAACAAVGIGADRIHEAELQDGAVTTAQVKATIVALADELDPDTGLWAPSYLVDNHPDHLAAGQAVRALGREQPTRFWDRRYIVLRLYWTDPRLAQVPGEVSLPRPPAKNAAGPSTPPAATAPGSPAPARSRSATTRPRRSLMQPFGIPRRSFTRTNRSLPCGGGHT